jgi:acyl-coenzyme A thioesterase PaaI-like protein
MTDASLSRLHAATDGVDGDLRDLRERAEGMGGHAFAEFIGLRHTAPGAAELSIRPELINGGGLLIGPVGFALVDYTMGSLLWSRRNPNEWIATINISLNFIQSANEGVVTCRSTLDRRNRHVAVLSSEVHHEDGRLLITAVGSFSIWIPRGLRGEGEAAAAPPRA